LLEGTSYGMRAGDFDGSGSLTVTDYNVYVSQISVIGTYIVSDAGFDGNVTVADYNAYIGNSSVIGVSAIRY